MLTHWQIELCESLDQAKGKQLKQVLRFARWYIRERLMELVEKANCNMKKVTNDEFYTALYVTYESEINECQLALKGKNKVWDATGKLLTKEQLKDRIESFEPLLQHCAMQLCEQCQKELSDSK
jgi:hypothetical protein